MTGPGPLPTSGSSLRKWAISILVAVVAVDVAARLFVAELPVLIPLGVGLFVVYVLWRLHRRNSSEW